MPTLTHYPALMTQQRPRIAVTQTQRLELNQSLQASIGILRIDAQGLTRYLEEQAAANPFLRLDAAPIPSLQDWLPRWSGWDGLAAHRSGQAMPSTDDLADAAPSLIAHVLAEVERLGLPKPQQEMALVFMDALEPSGWLGQSISRLAQEAGASEAEMQRVLKKLQTIDPPGIFARNLAECLALQAQDMGALDVPMQAMLQHLDVLATGDLGRMARLCAVSEPEVMQRYRLIRSMNPKPGSAFATLAAVNVREPDLVARKTRDGNWEVALNKSALPTVTVGEKASLPKSAAKTLGAHTAAKALVQMVAARNATLLRVGAEIVLWQSAALDEGAIALLPMTMGELAARCDLHESTISRVVAGASLDTPRGTWWLRQMFSPALGAEGGIILSGAALRHHLARTIAAEPKDAPLSDLALAETLSAQTGVQIARRTVAKYREMQNIPPAHRRKRRGFLAKVPPLSANGRTKG